MSDFVFCARGTGEPYAGNMLDNVVGRLRDVTVEQVVHSASISLDNAARDPLAPSGDNSATQIVNWLRTRIAALHPGDRDIVLGYSLGAVGVIRWLKTSPDTRGCLMVGTIADPSRRGGVSYGMPIATDRSGIYSTSGTGTVPHDQRSPVPLIEIASPGDVMTSCPAVSPLHAFAGPVMAFTLTDPNALIAQLVDDGIEDVVSDLANVGHWFEPGWWSWPADLAGFASGAHTTAYGLPMWRDSANRPVSGIDLLARVCSWKQSVMPV
ncbi:hypothetical protein [Tsukamurella pseudospumae]|uniref:PE-PPE domain-containing protein n=1 Tax=Tsukamurella pseudospumae TaxID=239498 RepID=A0A138A870_9ACTN|nr:hypothetical protein [Tsukamurella pseudospumae]KXO99099.1 hypothetical protein AXK61_17615 [Tsukamurella pseudospumae]KXP06580.1 hypothetical protein AXK60_10920 [Tsukamurella pseudospumae]